MNVFTNGCVLVVLFALLLEVIETGEAYKGIRPYKYYQRRPWRRSRWYAGHRSPKIYHSKRTPQEDYYSRGPGYYRHHSASKDLDDYDKNKPYTIVIQLPKGDERYGHDYYPERKRNYERDSIPEFTSGSDYTDDEEDIESEVVHVEKKLQIKMVKGENPQLHIKISRSDDGKSIEIIDKLNNTAVDLTEIENSTSTEKSEDNGPIPESSTPYSGDRQQN